MTDSRSEKPDARLVLLHAERGDPHARLAGALAALEGADWGLLLAGEDALARQLGQMLGGGTLRVDPRVRVSRDALAGAGLAVAGLDAEWRGARAVWLLEPDAQTLERARRAGVRVLVDGTLAPGGQWLTAGADLVVYRDSVTLSGHADAPLAALFGAGRAPEAAGAPPSDLSVALALRDVATLPLRLARAARTTSSLAERLGGAAQPAGPTALLLAPDAAADTPQALGGVLAAARSVPGGVLLTPGLQEQGAALGLLHSDGAGQRRPSQDEPRAGQEFQPAEQPRRDEGRNDGQRYEGRRDGRRDGPRRQERQERPGRFTRGDQPNAPQPSSAFPDTPEAPQRFTFEAPEASGEQESWEPEIVFSAQPPHPQVNLPTPVSSGPDAPTLAALPDVLHQPDHLPAADERPADTDEVQDSPQASPTDEDTAAYAPVENDQTPDNVPETDSPPAREPEVLTPDLPQGKQDPTADLTDEQAAVYARLREWRNAEAKRQDISRFIIASNATLAEIARRIPYTEADLRAVRGMGPERLRKYGNKILEVVRG
ncbi:HRDC domain-containing protein [Deinococcus navajonensis]|uniref:HRDC domain-containing protein n=1 Tax=Deinococcus navajonensis TaxID=309884 RepID=A0ABV8XQK8_9DEIO